MLNLTEREKEIIAAALSYAGSNVSDVNEAYEGDKEFNEEEIFELYSKVLRS